MIHLVSPIRSSPLSNPPVYSPSRTPTPSSHRPYAVARPIPASHPRRSSMLASTSTPLRPSPSSNLTTPSTTHSTLSNQSGRSNQSKQSTQSGRSTDPSPPLSRSHPLLGSYPLSLLHSRMSHAHTPHSILPSSTSGFSLHIGSLGRGRHCPPELRCPAHVTIPFRATYYDLEDGGRTTQTPWVGTVDLEEHYFTTYAQDVPAPSNGLTMTSQPSPAAPLPPPAYPGYKVAPLGQLQILIKTPNQAVKVFLIPYDLRNLPIGGRLLARERTFVQSQSTTTRGNDVPSSPTPSRSSPTRATRERLRYSFQLQFICAPRTDDIPSSTRSRESSTTRRLRTRPPINPDLSPSAPQPASKTTSTTKSSTRMTEPPIAKDYYISKTIKVIFTSTPPEKDEMGRTERTDEMVLPQSDQRGRMNGSSPGWTSKSEFASGSFGNGGGNGNNSRKREDWDVVTRKWQARRQIDAQAFDIEIIRPISPIPTPSPTPPISLLSSQVASPPGVLTPLAPLSLSLSPSPAGGGPPTLPILSPRPRYQTLVEPPTTPTRIVSPQPSSIKTPIPRRYPTRQKLRRGSGSYDERELSEKLRGFELRIER